MRYILTAIVAMAVSTVCQARTIYVDANSTGDYPTIQAAVNDSNTGDVIILLSGKYTGVGNRNIDSNGKSITVQGTDPCDPAIVAATIIDCQRMGRGFKFIKGESSLLAGFTIINGNSPSPIFPPLPPLPLDQEYGDAIYSKNSSPTIFNCVIKKCGGSGISPPIYSYGSEAIYCDNSYIKLIGCTISENGYAINCFDSNAEITGCTINNNFSGIGFGSSSVFPVPTPVIRNNVKITDSIITGNNRAIGCNQTNLTIERSTISDNNTTSLYTGLAGIAAKDSNMIINNSIISRNKSFVSSPTQAPYAAGVTNVNGTLDMNNCLISENKAVNGGGIVNYQGTATIKNCVITNNTAGGLSGSQYYAGKGGGIYSYNPKQLVIEGCTIKDNKAEGNPANTLITSGGGIYSQGSLGTVSVKNCSIIHNKAKYSGGIDDHSYMDVNNCLFANNEAEFGGGISCTTAGSRYINCTFVGNKAVSCAGISGGSAVVSNCILWDDIFSGNAQGIEVGGSAVEYSNVRWGWGYPYPSGSNISIDPLFTFENDGHLLPGSPCIDAGTNTPIGGLSATDFDGNPRVVDGDSDGKATVDMGAFEFNSAVSRLAISDSEFTFSCAKDGPNPEPQVLQIRNCNGGNLDWEIIENCPWLNVSPKIGTSSGSPSSVTIALDANQLDIGTYQADMLITSPGAAGSPQTVHVTVKVCRLLSVPQSFYTIQKAIDDANNGDWVVVADGIYTGAGNRDIDFRGKAITVHSQNGPETCIIDCNGTPAEPHQAFVFHTGETYSSILDGFTITNGYSDLGGAIRMNSTPTIKNCVFNKNTSMLQGGAILASTPYSPGKPPMPIVMERCSFIENSTKDMGGAIYSNWSLKLTDCNFIGNATDIYGYKGGGGIGLENYSSASCSALVEGCNFTGNFARMGGAINAVSNTAGNISIINSTFIGNVAEMGPGALNIVTKFNITISNSAIAGNRGRNRGGITLFGPSQITNCTIVGNSSIDNSPSSVSILGRPANIKNCIIADYGPGILNNHQDATVAFSNVLGGFPGEGNFDIDPGFVKPGYWADPNDPNIILEPNDLNAVWVNGDYHLRVDSPCIDAGDPNYVPGTGETDLDGNPRVVDVVDMGAYEHQNTAPVANAGPNQVAYAWIDGIAEVTLDANNSYDADGDALTYLWKWSIDGNDYETNGINPTIELPVGQYTFELVVNDGREDSEPNQVVITVIEPIKSMLWVTPRVINGRSQQPNILVMLQLPAGISKKQIDAGKKLVLYPGEIEANYQVILRHYENSIERVVIFACFDKSVLMDAIGKAGRVQLDVAGQLKTGQYFYGSDNVWIINPPPHKPKPKDDDCDKKDKNKDKDKDQDRR